MAALVAAVPLVASADTNLNFDTGKTGGAGFGDITFNGSTIAAVGSAKLADLTTALGSEFSTLVSGGFFETLLASESYTTTPIGSSSLVVNEVFAVKTNGGNYGAALVTAASSGSITLTFVTYNPSGSTVAQGSNVTLGGSGAAGAPTITLVQNNYSYILPNAPNYGIAPGTLVLISGSGMAAPGSSATPLQDPSKALPTTWNGSQVTITVGGTSVNPAFYYATPSYLAVVIPSKTPVGTGTIMVSYGGQNSAAVPITIVAHAAGFLTYPAAPVAGVTDNTDGHLITTTDSAKPGEQIVFWGSGDGADTNNDDVNPPKHFDNLSGITALYFGSVLVPIEYQGRSGYQGVDQINVQVPANAPTGCAVSVVGVIGSGSTATTTNAVSMPIATNGGTCSDTQTFVDPGTASGLQGKTTVKFGGLAVSEFTDYETGTPTVIQEASGVFYSISGYSLTGYTSSSLPSLGSCFVTQSNSSTVVNPFTFTGLDAGTLTVTGPDGEHTLQTISQEPGIYFYQPQGSGFIPASGGTYTFAGTGGANVGAFSNASVAFLNPLTWTNYSSDGTVTRASGVTVNWTGGAAGTFVEITGDSVSSGLFSASFLCTAPVTAGTFMVPPAVLLQLPAGTGSLSVSNYTDPKSLSIPNLDFSYIMAYAGSSISATYN
jgi:uncharacterized protein (TIGR03437 family)